jgi:CheY-like chemotaxis protein
MKTALLVDDDQIFCMQLIEVLDECLKNCFIVVAGNGKEAEKITRSSQLDFVLTDLNMPVMDGYEFVSRAKVSHPFLPILIMTGMKTPEVERRLHLLGISRCIQKPFDIRDMVPQILSELAGIISDDDFKPSFNPDRYLI